jgi:outer membrane protein assembly factor BamE (lipoprotein component of BamABCDE complex)
MRNQKSIFLILVICIFFILTGCAPQALIPARQTETRKITLGDVQSKIKIGVTNSDVVNSLGSPNIVTTNRDGTETWVYDKFITESEYAGGFMSSTSASSSRTLLVILKFDKNQIVEKVDYRQTSY